MNLARHSFRSIHSSAVNGCVANRFVNENKRLAAGVSNDKERQNSAILNNMQYLTTINGAEEITSIERNTFGKSISLQKSFLMSKKKTKVMASRFRPVVYTEGELDKSDLTQPPSKSNPHPLNLSNPSLFPPTHSWSIAHYVNHLPVLQILVELGVDLFEVDSTSRISRQLVKLDWEKDVKPKLIWLVHQVGMPISDVGSYLTRNPYFLLQSLENMQVRLNYLYAKRLCKTKVLKIVKNSRFWLNIDVTTTDSRLGWIQKTFELTGDEVRDVIVNEPRLIMYGIGPLERLVIMLTEEMEFTKEQVKAILMKDPRVFMIQSNALLSTFRYLRFTMNVTNAQIAEWPVCLRFAVGAVRKRHEFLIRLNKADYIEGSPNYVPLSALLQPSDQKFAVNVAHTYLCVYNSFLKNY